MDIIFDVLNNIFQNNKIDDNFIVDKFDVIDDTCKSLPMSYRTFMLWMIDVYYKLPKFYTTVHLSKTLEYWAEILNADKDELQQCFVDLLMEYKWPYFSDILQQSNMNEDIHYTVLHKKPNQTKWVNIYVGAPGSGKSTSQTLSSKSIISRDDFIMDRYKNQSTDYIQCYNLSVHDKQCDKAFMQHATEIFKSNDPLIVLDLTNMNVNSRRKWINMANMSARNVRMVVMLTPRKECIERQINRKNKNLSETIITEKFLINQIPWLGVECDELLFIR